MRLTRHIILADFIDAEDIRSHPRNGGAQAGLNVGAVHTYVCGVCSCTVLSHLDIVHAYGDSRTLSRRLAASLGGQRIDGEDVLRAACRKGLGTKYHDVIGAEGLAATPELEAHEGAVLLVHQRLDAGSVGLGRNSNVNRGVGVAEHKAVAEAVRQRARSTTRPAAGETIAIGGKGEITVQLLAAETVQLDAVQRGRAVEGKTDDAAEMRQGGNVVRTTLARIAEGCGCIRIETARHKVLRSRKRDDID